MVAKGLLEANERMPNTFQALRLMEQAWDEGAMPVPTGFGNNWNAWRTWAFRGFAVISSLVDSPCRVPNP